MPETLFGAEPTTRAEAAVHGAATAGVSGAISGLGGALGILSPAAAIGAIPAMLAYGVTDLMRRITTGTLMDPAPSGPPTPLDPESLGWFARHPASKEYATEWALSQGGGDPFTFTVMTPGAPYWDIYTGEVVTPATNPNWEAEWLAKQSGAADYTPPPPTFPTPAEIEPLPPSPREPSDTTRTHWRDEPMSWISTSIGGLFGGLTEGIGSLVEATAPLAQWSAPLWAPKAPVAAQMLGVGGMPATGQPATQPVAMTQPQEDLGEVGMPNVPTAQLVSGVRTAGWDLMVPESQRIQPIETAGRRRMPASFTVPYEDSQGRTKYAHYRNQGRVMLYSGDLAAVKRVKRVAAKARRRVGGR
jgi:hypothetical protein